MSGNPKLYDREEELALIRGLVARVGKREHAAISVAGSSGTGKSSLLARAGVEARKRGVPMLQARGDELESALPWGLVLQLFDSEIKRRGLPAGPAAPCRPLFEGGSIAGRSTQLHPLLHGLYWLVVELAEADGLILAIDDAQLADAESLKFLSYLMNRSRDLPLGLILAQRSGDPDGVAAESYLQRLCARPENSAIELTPLADDAVRRLVADRLVGDRPELASRISRMTAGNPLFCRLMLDHLLARGADAGTEDPIFAQAALGTTIRSRLRRHGSEALRVANSVAILGPGATVARVAKLSGLDSEAAARLIDSLGAAGLLTEELPVRFVHPIVRELVDADLATGARAILHGRAAKVLYRERAPHSEVAAHLLRSVVDEYWAIDVLRAAAADAIRVGAPSRAAELLSAALPLAGHGELGATVLVELGGAELATGRSDGLGRLDQALDLAGGLTRRQKAAELALEIAEACFAAGYLQSSRKAFERGLDWDSGSNGPDASVTRARLLAGYNATSILAGDPQPAVRQRIETLSVQAVADPDMADRVLMAMAAGDRAMAGVGPIDEVVRMAGGAVDGGDLPRVLGRVVLEPAISALLWSDCLELADTAITDVLRSALERGEFATYSGAMVFRAYVSLARGPIADAAARSAEVLRIAEQSPDPVAGNVAAATWIAVLAELELTDTDAAARVLSRVGSIETDSSLGAYLHLACGQVRLASGEIRSAKWNFLEAGRILERVSADGAFMPWRTGAALACARLGEDRAANRLAAEEWERASAFGAVGAISRSLRCRAALIRDHERSVDLLLEADAVTRGSEAVVERARALTDLGAALRRANRSREARDWLRQGLDLAREAGARTTVARATAELEAAGARRPHLRLRGVEALTPSQRRIAEMAASGQGNAEIAAELFVTRRTVEAHLTATFRKLGIQSREQLPEALV